MKTHSKIAALAFTAFAFSITGCNKQPAHPAAAKIETPAPAPAAMPSTAPPASGSASTADTTAKIAGTQWALKQDEIKNDPKGQWAIAAEASSTYNDAKGTAGWSANQATGAPNVDKYADDGHAWAPKSPDAGIEWLVLTFPKPVHAE